MYMYTSGYKKTGHFGTEKLNTSLGYRKTGYLSTEKTYNCMQKTHLCTEIPDYSVYRKTRHTLEQKEQTHLCTK